MRLERRFPRLVPLAVVLSTVWVAPATAIVIPEASGPAMVVGPDGFGLIAYYDRVNGDLKVAHCLDAACDAVTTQTVDSAGDVGHYPAIAMGSAGPVITYGDATQRQLKLALCADAQCTAASVVLVEADLGGVWYIPSAVAIGSDGRPLVAYASGGAPPMLLTAAHCDDAACATMTRTTVGITHSFNVAIGIGGDGLGAILHTRYGVEFVHCANTACTAVTPPTPGARALPAPGMEPPSPFYDLHPSVVVGADGFVRYASIDGPVAPWSVRVTRCLDALCDRSVTSPDIPAYFHPMALALGPEGFYRLALIAETGLTLDTARCLDGDCSAYQQDCAAGLGAYPALVVAPGGPLVAFERGDNVEVLPPPTTCSTAVVVRNAQADEGDPPRQNHLRFAVHVQPPPAAPLTFTYTTVDGSAQSPADYQAASGVLTYQPGSTPIIQVPVTADIVPEAEETMEMVLSLASGNANLADGRGRGTIVDDDPPAVSVGGCATPEGDSGTSGCLFEVTIAGTPWQVMRVDYATSGGTATAGVDYLPVSGTLTFQPEALSQVVSVPVAGDRVVELDETMALTLTNPVNVAPGSMTALGTIVDDDATPLSSLELTHGARVTADLAVAPGPTADVDLYRLAQGPYSSWEVVVDEVSGDVAPGLELQLLAEDNSTIATNSIAVGAGPARSLRWEHRSAAAENRHHVRVRSASCTTDCGPEDTYRLRAYETTGVIPRFNNSGSQLTVLLLQNTTDLSVPANADFWDAAGARRETVPLLLPPRGVAVVNTGTLPALAGLSGSITVTHAAGYGRLVGKAVALEPSTGFSFDTPMTSKAR